jgi:2-C-methyl-D-erythritol 4-phosphate cytidylyltransferase/2-C-methyl-D-erythritol 2,4-cyclodiphosphate synthase
MGRAALILVAAGKGERAGGDLPKQYQLLAGRPLLTHTLAAFAQHPHIGPVVVVIDPTHRDLYDQAVAALGTSDLQLLPPVAGGPTRQESVMCGLGALVAAAPSRVLIHDAARPFADHALIDRVIHALDHGPAVIAALPVVDTLKRGQDGHIAGTVDRSGLWRAQTPQGFHFQAILDAHRAAIGQDLTDDAAIMEAAGLKVALVMGSEENVKVTTPEDIVRAERTLAAAGPDTRLPETRLPDVRVASGFDVHTFGPGDHIMLCGVKVAHSHGLVGHSDADVGLHAITDGVLGTIAAGDIGQHFPPSDARWKGADSSQFLAHAASLVAEKGGVIAHVDLTIICERPKVGPHRAAMQARVAEILGLSLDRVAIKATTTEGMGFTGRSEGIAAQATVTARLPL